MKITLAANTSWYIYNFRRNLIRSLQGRGFEVSVVAPHDNYVDKLTEIGVKHYGFTLSQRGKNPLREVISCMQLFRLLRIIKPDVVLTFTVKCNLYTGICRRFLKFEQIVNISGLGEAFDQVGFVNCIVSQLYKFALAKAKRIFFQNDDDLQTIIKCSLLPAYLCKRIPGSGIDLNTYYPAPAIPKNGARRFLMFGRLVPKKGYDLFMQVAEAVLKQNKRCAEFLIMGMIDKSRKESKRLLERILLQQERGVVEYLAPRDDVLPVLHAVDVVVLPSQYNEGVPRCLLEAMACGKPIVTTDWKGCRDTVQHESNGYLIRPGNREELEYYVRKLASIPEETLREMGEASRRKAEAEFAEKYILECYLNEIKSAQQPEPHHNDSTARQLVREDNIEQLVLKHRM